MTTWDRVFLVVGYLLIMFNISRSGEHIANRILEACSR